MGARAEHWIKGGEEQSSENQRGGTRFATDVPFNMINVFVLAYAKQQLGLSRGLLLNAVIVGSVSALGTLPLFSGLSDRVGRRTVFLCGCVFVAIYGFVFFPLPSTRDPLVIVIAYILESR